MGSPDEIINLYLEMETNYALLLTGEWGVGKTFYYKNVLENLIKEKATFYDKGRNYKPIRISLFGLKSIEDIQSEIFFSIYPLAKSKILKLTAKTAQIFIKGYLALKGLGSLNSLIEVQVTDKDKKDLVHLDNIVLCFDDLERISPALKIEEFIGYINSIVEESTLKVILIANENKILKKSYSSLKEKVIGNTIEFNLDFSKVYPSIVNSKFEGFGLYKGFLLANEKIMQESFIPYSSNLRVLTYALSHFQYVFSAVTNLELNEPELKKREIEILSMLLKFTIVIAIEYKTHQITFKERNELDKNDFMISYSGFQSIKKKQNENDVTELSYKDLFLKKYYQGDGYNYFSSIFDFITGGSSLAEQTLLKELREKYHINNKKLLPQYELIGKLEYHKLYLMSDKEYKIATRKLLNYGKAGSYDLLSYLTVFYFVIRFDNLLNISVEKLEKDLIKGMQKGFSTYKFIPDLDFHLTIHSDNDHFESLQRIKLEAVRLNSTIEDVEFKQKSKAIEKLFYDDLDGFLEKYGNSNNDLQFTPIFQFFNPNNFYSYFLKSSNRTKNKIIYFLRGRYRRQYEELAPEQIFLAALNKKIENRLKVISGQPSTSLFKELNEIAKSMIKPGK